MSFPVPHFFWRIRPSALSFAFLSGLVGGAICPGTAGAAVATVATVAAEGPARIDVVLQEVEDDRYSKGPIRGSLVVTLNLRGAGAETAGAARPIVNGARDDKGTSLLVEPAKVPDFIERNVNGGRLDVKLRRPERAARTFSLSGAVELFDPSRDPGAVVRVENALAKKDKKLSSKGLKAAKVEVTLLSKAKYEAEQKKQELREMGGPVPEDAVILSIPSAQNEKILSVRLVDAAGKELSVPISESSSGGKATTRVLRPEKTPPPDAGLVFTLLTEKARVFVAFDLKEIPLP